MCTMRTLAIILSLLMLPLLAEAQCGRLDSLYRVLRVAKADSDKINTLNALVEELIVFGKEGQASFYATQALKMAKEVDYDKGIADALSHIGLMDSRDVRQMQKTIEEYEAALKIYEELGDQEKAAQMHEVIGNYHFKMENMEDYQLALTHFDKAIALRKANKQDKEAARNYEVLGEIYGLLKKDEQALIAFEKAQALKKTLGEEDIHNAYVLAKYRRIKALEERLQKTDAFVMSMIFAIVLSILLVVLFAMIIQRNKALDDLKELKGLNIEEAKKA